MKILIISTATAICTSVPNGKDILEIAKSLIQLDNNTKIDVLSLLDPYEDSNLKIIQIKSQIAHNYSKRDFILKHFVCNRAYLSRILGRIMLRYIRWQESKLSYVDKMDFGLLKKWLSKNRSDYDMIISVSHPFYTHKYAKFIKGKLGIKKWVVYILDIYADSYSQKNLSIAMEEEQSCFEGCDKIFIVDRFIEKAKYSPIKNYLSKTVSIPYHLIKDKTQGDRLTHHDNKIHLVYGGSLLETIRNPRKLFEVMGQLPNHIVLDLYSRGCDDIIEEFSYLRNISFKGLIEDSDEYDKVLRGADILISLGNSVDNFVPSKVFDYCCYGKPIIHFVNCEDDYVVRALRFHPLICFINYQESINVIAEKMNSFIQEHRNVNFSYDLIRNFVLPMTIETTTQNLLKVLK